MNTSKRFLDKGGENMNFLEGKKTIITGVVMIIFGIAGLLLGKTGYTEAVELIGTGAGFIFLKLGQKK
jgi:hypothetical protein